MEEKGIKILTILGTITAILFIAFLIFMIIEFKEMLNDHRCYQLPPEEFYSDIKCKRYWETDK